MTFDANKYHNSKPYVRKSQDIEMYTEYCKEEMRIHEQFRVDMQKEFGLDALPPVLADAVHSHCWENGHSSGYAEVHNYYYSNLVTSLVDYFNEH